MSEAKLTFHPFEGPQRRFYEQDSVSDKGQVLCLSHYIQKYHGQQHEQLHHARNDMYLSVCRFSNQGHDTF
jgi:hypothetical protein